MKGDILFKNKMKNILKSKFILAITVFFCILGFNILIVNASDTDGELLDVYPIPGIQFTDHVGMKPSLHGHFIYCAQRGYPFRSMCSEMQMCRGTYEGKEGKLNDIVGYFNQPDLQSGLHKWYRGWGSDWQMNSDYTDAIQLSDVNAPSSDERDEAFDRFKNPDESEPDDENDRFTNRYQGGEVIRRFIDEVGYLTPPSWGSNDSKLTGHEGTRNTYNVRLKKITYAEAGYDMPRVYAGGILNYYVWEDADVSGYSEDAKFRVMQAFTWAMEAKFVTTMGNSGKALRVIYKNSSGKYGAHVASTYSGSADGYMKTTIGSFYEEMKLYRQVVWKTTNMRVIPSFASYEAGSAEPIKLYWDEEQHLYTATVSDHNGVLNYFDFSVPGCTVTNNGDGTLTISASGQVNATSGPSQSKLEPEDGVFKLPVFLRWANEKKTKTFTYALLQMKDNWVSGKRAAEQPDGSDLRTEQTRIFEDGAHSLNYDPPCSWYCTTDAKKVTHCTEEINNCHEEPNNCGKSEHSHSGSCYDKDGNKTCGMSSHSHNSSCHSHEKEGDKCHKHYEKCWHQYTCPFWKKQLKTSYDTVVNGVMPISSGADACDWHFACSKFHWDVVYKTIEGTYADWQDPVEYTDGQKIIDPEICYIRVETVPHEFPAETDTEILLIADNDEWNDLTYTTANGKTIKHSSHLRVGEKFHLKYIYSYKGASKGFRIEFSLDNKPYYQYNYLSRMDYPDYYNKPIYELRTGLAGDRFSQSSISVPHAKLVQDLTDIKIRGLYTTPETAYTLNGVYSWNSGDRWNDKVYLDALVTEQFDDNYVNKPVGSITSTSGAAELTEFKVTKPSHNEMIVTWEFDVEPEVFSSALVYGTAYIEVGKDDNFTKNYFDEAYNYAKDEMTATQWTPWSWNSVLGAHNNVGGVGYFSSEYTGEGGPQSNNPIPRHVVYTQNNEYLTYAIRNKVWQSDVDIQVSNFVQNTGAGITEHIYQERGRNTHDMNYNLYYTIDVKNPKATIFADKQRSANGSSLGSETTTTPYDTSSDVYEFDVNNLISWGSTGASQTPASYGTTTVVDHIKTGTTYIQREIPTVLTTMTSNPKETMTFKINPNHDRLIYEDYYTNANISGSGTNRKVAVSVKDGYYPPNEQTAVSDIWPAMNPNVKEMQPQNIGNSNNVPDQYNQSDNVLHHMAPTTSFNIKLSNGETKTVVDSHTKNYTQYDFEYNPTNRDNKVTFPSRRKSIMFFKYSKTNYSYDGKNVQSAVGEFRNSNKTQTESYYISQVLFKSNYTSKYKKELEAQGADYIEDHDVNGNLLDAWIDMVNQNKFAIVSAGQGFELRVTLKYENSYLTQYLSRYFGQDDGQNDIIGTSNRVQKNYLTSTTEKGRQFANISSLTGKDGRSTPYYKDTERAYISSNSILDRLAVNLVTGSNVFNDLYVFMSDNPDTVYSYSGIYDTPVVFERDIKYSEDFSVTTVTYTMCVSHENGISSNLQKMKFYTNQLAPDKRSPGIVEGMVDVSANGEHSITIWTPIVAATPFDYPNTMQDRYIGDAIELGYTIKTTGADDAIVHIVQ